MAEMRIEASGKPKNKIWYQRTGNCVILGSLENRVWGLQCLCFTFLEVQLHDNEDD